MGSDNGCLQPNGFYLNGLLPNKADSVTRVLDLERWTRAEERTAELISHIQPDQPSWEHRNAIASYVQRLILQCIPCVAFVYGSVPLKTYLPDGDIDLTVFGEDQNFNDNWATEVREMLEKEEKNVDAEFVIREVQLIQAEVKLVKCLVDNIVVDISFSQLGGLCTLCFLEQVDRYINQNHLFKRSIILIKAWCYYESRLLGAYHGLISTYALETMILYIFHVFNNSFAGPLEVLYRFLEFFSKFDWDNFCISLLGPVPISSLPDKTADPPRKDGGALLLSRMFLDTCSSYYSVLPSTHEIKEQFVPKHFNIIDFLRTNNNLGRSVSRGNLFRIRSAFAFGARRLAGLLDCPQENVVTELNRFFVNTWNRHVKVRRPDIGIVHASDLGREDSEHSVQKRNSKETNSVASEDSYKRLSLDASQNFLDDGVRIWRSKKVLQSGVQFENQFARTCSSPELTNASSELLHGGILNGERERLQDKSIPVFDHSRKTGGSGVVDCHSIKFNAADPCPRENSPSESYAGDVDSASVSNRNVCDYAMGEDSRFGCESIQKSANMMHSSWIQTFGGQCQFPANVPSPIPVLPSYEAQWNLSFYHPHWPPFFPVIGQFNDNLVPEERNKQVDDHGLWDYEASSFKAWNPENGLFCSDMERKQNPSSACEYSSSGQTIVCSHSVDRKQCDLVTENRESGGGKYFDETRFPSASFTACTSYNSKNDSLEDKLGTASTMDPKPVIIDYNKCQNQANMFEHFSLEVNGDKDGIRFSNAGTPIPPITISHTESEAHQIPTSATTNWGFPSTLMTLHPCAWPTASHNYPVFPVTLLPPAVPYVSMLPYLTYTSHFEGKEVSNTSVSHFGPTLDTADPVEQPDNASRPKFINGIGSAQHSERCTSDILSGDFDSHLNSMLYGRSCQTSQFQGPFAYHPSLVPTQYLQGEFLLGNPGRPSSATANDTILPEVRPMPISHHYPNQTSLTGGYQRYPRGIPKHGMGTGTYLPSLKNRDDFQSSSSRHRKGKHNNHRKEQRKEREVNSNFNSKPQFASRSCQGGKPNSRFDLSAARNSRVNLQWKAIGDHSRPTYVVCPYDPNSTYGSLEHPPADSVRSLPDQPSSPGFKGSLMV